MKYGKSPPPFGEGLDVQPDHLYTTYRSVVNLIYTDILASAKQKVKSGVYENYMLVIQNYSNSANPKMFLNIFV